MGTSHATSSEDGHFGRLRSKNLLLPAMQIADSLSISEAERRRCRGRNKSIRLHCFYVVSLEGRSAVRRALQSAHRTPFMEHVLQQTKAPATVANAGEDVIMEMDTDLF